MELQPASEDDIALFERDRSGPGPTPPYVPNWNVDTLEGEWNTMLFNLLLQHGGGEHDEDETNELKEMFFDKLRRVRRKIKEAQPKAGESPADAQQRFSADCARKRADQRPHTRRRTVSEYAEKSYMIVNILNQTYEERMGICIENVNQLTGDAREVWSNLYEMVDAMGADGVSSDEESVVDNKRVYHVKALPHRSARVLSRVKFIDSQANHTNGYGNNASGTPPRIRIRPEEPQESNRKVPTGWPENFYKAGWLEKLSDINYGRLEAKADLDLIPFSEVQRFAGVSDL